MPSEHTRNYFHFEAGRKIYELGNHLGNVLATIGDRKLQVEGDDDKVGYYLPDVLTMTDYYPFGSPLPGRTESQLSCGDVTVPVIAFAVNENFDSDAGGFTAVNGSTVTQTVTGRLQVERTTCVGCGNWGTSKTFSQTGGKLYHVAFFLNVSTCGSAGLNTVTVRIKNASGTVIATQAYTTTGDKTFSFTANQTGTGSIEFLVSNTGCDFLVNDVAITYSTTTTQELCESYRFGFNGQMKDDEVYGEGNAYTADYWEYDPRIGRRWNIDPIIKPWISSYATFGNSPIKNADPSGDDWVVEKTEKDGKTTYNVTINAVMYNNSGEKVDMVALKQKIIDQVKAVYGENVKGDEVIINTEINLREINSLDELKPSEHLISIESNANYDKYAGKDHPNTNAYSDVGGLTIFLPIRTVNGIIKGEEKYKRTIAHEFGHTAGLYHPDVSNSTIVQGVNKYDKSDDNNFMYGTGSGMEINKSQIEIIYQNFIKGRINQQNQLITKSYFYIDTNYPYIHTGEEIATPRMVNHSAQNWANWTDNVFGP